MKKNIRALLIVLCVILVGVFAVSGYQLFTIVHNYKVAERTYTGLSDQYVSRGGVISSNLPGTQGEESEVVEYTEFSPIAVDFDALLETCPDIVGWLYCPDTVIDYPVVQGTDNDFYLHHMYDGRYNPNGTLFVDFRCAEGFSARHTIIYGHHMNDGSMFASLVNYKKQDYYDAHPVMYLNTPDGNYRIDVFSGFVTSASSSVYTFEFDTDLTYAHFLTKMRDFSDFSCEVELSPEDRIVTLSTCTYEYDDARYVVLGKLVPIG